MTGHVKTKESLGNPAENWRTGRILDKVRGANTLKACLLSLPKTTSRII